MQIYTKRFVSAASAFLMLLTASCGGGSGSVDTTADNPSESGDAETTTAAAYAPPEVDYKGYEFKMLIPLLNQTNFENAEITGDVVSDAIHDANRKVESIYNITLKVTAQDAAWAARTDFMNTIRNSILADDDAYDVVFPTYYFGEELCAEGNFLDINALKEINLAEDWWISGYNDQAVMNGKLYGAVGEYGLTDLAKQDVLYFNKRLYTDYGFENIYDLVREGKWTFEKFLTMINGLGKDLDNNSVMDKNDFYGYICNTNGLRSFTVNFGLNFAKVDKNGVPSITFGNEKMYDVYDRLYSLIYKTGDANASFLNTNEDMMGVFMNGNALFMTGELERSAIMREMDDDFGIIPMPKYDENQESYITYSTGPALQCIPRTADDPTRTAHILDALNFCTYTEVTPAYYEIALKSKYARDNDTAEMLDIIRSGVYYDFGFIYGSLLEYIADLFGNTLTAKTEGLASVYAGKKDAVEASLKKLIETFDKLD